MNQVRIGYVKSLSNTMNSDRKEAVELVKKAWEKECDAIIKCEESE